jgi:hypothetical protein
MADRTASISRLKNRRLWMLTSVGPSISCAMNRCRSVPREKCRQA